MSHSTAGFNLKEYLKGVFNLKPILRELEEKVDAVTVFETSRNQDRLTVRKIESLSISRDRAAPQTATPPDKIERRDSREKVIYRGSCHCGAVTFEVEAPEHLEVDDCNCSICSKSGYLHLIVPKTRFKLLSGEENLATYTFQTGIAQHKFCKTCGIKSFYIPRSNPDGIDVNARCLDTRPQSLSIVPFDGVNWEKNAHTVAYKSREISQ